MKSKRFFAVLVSTVFVAAFVVLSGTAWSDGRTGNKAGIIKAQQGDQAQTRKVTPEKKTPERKSGYVAGQGIFSSFPEYEEYDPQESDGSPYWGFMRDN